MKAQITGVSRLDVWLLALVVPSVAATTMFIVVFDRQWTAIFGLAAVLALIALWRLPLHWLPGLAIALFVLVPLDYMPIVNPIFGRYISPALLVLAFWMIRTASQAPRINRGLLTPWGWLSLGLIGLGLASSGWSLDPQRSILWVLTAGTVFVGFAWMGRRADSRTLGAVTSTWLWLGLVVGTMAVVEGATHTSFLATFYASEDSSSIGFSQLWSTFRVTTTLGHPLMNATFLATTSAFALIHAARVPCKLAVLAGTVCGIGAVLTVSRSAVGALAVGLCLGILTMLGAKTISFGRKVFWGLTAILGAFAVVTSPVIQARSASAEGEGSSGLRSVLLDIAINVAVKDGLVGSGAGTSADRSVLEGLYLPFENSYAGILVSLGIAGLILFILLIVGVLVAAIAHGNFAVAAGLTAFAIQIAAYPLVDNVPIGLIILGMLSYLGFGSSVADDHETGTELA